MNAPVYIVTGFLDSGKTTFIQEMITDEGFSEGERTLLLCCEEGEVEYDAQMLKDNNTVLYTFEDMDELAGDKLVQLDKEYRPERVIIEYNSTWLMETLYSAKKPKNWDLAQIICLVDSNTYEIYLKNMRQFMADGLKEADLVIFNRSNDETPKSSYRRSVLGLNNSVRLFFENTDGTTDDGVSEEDLPYDVKADVIEIADTDFGIFYLDALEHPDRYDGKKIHARGRAFRMEDMPKNCYVFGRHVMTCCADDIGGIGFLCKYKDVPPQTNDWIFLTANVEASFSPMHGCDAIILIEEKCEPAGEPEEELVYFN
ncbi:MAG: GTPase [Clostridiales bacterium]|nr:GTPase [Clostridiales bacterium]